MICKDCRSRDPKDHELCPGDTYCDCQHRLPDPGTEDPSQVGS
jgi:hypothetical protein